MAGTFIYLPPGGGGESVYWGSAVATAASLPAAGEATGQVVAVIDTVSLYMWDGAAWQLIVDGTADVHGPASSTENALARYSDTSGKVIDNSLALLDDSGNLSGLLSVTVPTVRGSSASGGDLQLSSTSNATKGNINLGSLSTYDEVNDRLGLGTTSPNAPLHIRNDSDLSAAGDGIVKLENHNDSATSDPHIEFRRARASNADLQNGDTIGAIDFHPRHNGTFTNVAQIHAIYTGNGTTRSGDLRFDTGNNSAPTERMRITASGAVQIASLTDERLVRAGASGALETTSITVDDNGGMAFGTTTSALTLPILTTTQRNALTPTAGMVIFNSTTNRPEFYIGAPDNTWLSLGWGV
jgi:hypothetical protein